MNIELAYGEEGLTVEMPMGCDVLAPPSVSGLVDERAAVRHVLRNPIGSKPLRDRVKAEDRVVIVISDITRPTPNEKLVPWIMDELPHVRPEQITVLNGTGTHRDQTPEEFERMLGKEVMQSGVQVLNHHCRSTEELTYLGESTFGCPVLLNKAYTEADFRIVTGFIEPHFFAGFSGGPKGIMPGIAGLETIQTFHNAEMIGHPSATWGVLEGNPLQKMTREINRMCPPDFLLNVALNEHKEITSAFAGEWEESHREGCEFVRSHCMIPCEHAYDVVITSNAGYPLDQNLYQAVKGMSAASQIVKPGGAIIVAAECRDGMPDHGRYAEILRMGRTPEEVLQVIEDPAFRMMDQWQVQKQMVIARKATVYVYSTLPAATVRAAKCEPCDNIADVLLSLEKQEKRPLKVAVLPQGPLAIPYLR